VTRIDRLEVTYRNLIHELDKRQCPYLRGETLDWLKSLPPPVWRNTASDLADLWVAEFLDFREEGDCE
jgi:hypothetical protein